MASAGTLSPATEGRCILHSSNNDSIAKPQEESGFCKMPTAATVGFVSAPEMAEIEENIRTLQQSGRPGRGRRRKRRNSISENPGTGNNFSNQNGKRRRGNNSHKNASGRIILPNKFLLGGNITDPLNLNSMMDEKINRALNAVTPSSSPLPPRNSTIDIVMPSDVTDPLGLNSSASEAPTIAAELPKHKGRRKRRRRNITKLQEQQQNSDTTSSDDPQAVLGDIQEERQNVGGTTPAVDLENVDSKKFNPHQKKKKHSPPKVGNLPMIPTGQANIKDPIVSPVVPQDIRRYRSALGHKNRRRKQSSAKPLMTDAGIQTDSADIIVEQLRCGSEKIPDRNFTSPVKRRRTVSENLERWKSDENVVDSMKNAFSKDVTSLLRKSICGDVERISESAKSPAQDYMNKEIKYQRDTTEVSNDNETSCRKRGKPKEDAGGEIANAKDNDAKSRAKKQSKRPQTARFQYGNYNKYYGYRNPEKFKDVRMEHLRKEWFKDKDVLDIGCNAGHLTLLIARDYQPRKIVGVDIDNGLIRTARNNIRHYASTGKSSMKFPASMAISFGPLACPPVETGKDETTAAFPNNVNFFQGNYVPQKDEFLRFQEPEYDVIMCMSVSKWVHLNWGDDGLIRMFRRVYKQLRAGGMFILEPQQWSSYKSKRKTSEKLNENFHSIKLFPQSFPNFLLKEIGFERVDHLNFQKRNQSSGFQRPIQVYYKPE